MTGNERTEGQTYDVLMRETSSFAHMDESDEWYVRGFPTLELAREFARRWVRSCVEDARRAHGDPLAWRLVGENAIVEGHYKGSDDVAFFAANPAMPEEVDWQAVKREAGLVTDDKP